MPRKLLAYAFFFALVAGLLTFAAFHNLRMGGGISHKGEAENIVRKCSSVGNKIECYNAEFASLTRSQGIEDAFAVLDLVRTMDSLSQDCHFIAHTIGGIEAKKDISKWKDVVSNRCPVTCDFGCMHGALQAYVGEAASPVDFGALLKDVCVDAKLPFCPHIIGHLLLVEADNNIEKALRMCREISKDSAQSYECFTGVFMEEQLPFTLVSHGLLDKSALDWKKHLLESKALCGRFGGLYGGACWLELAHVVIKAEDDPRRQFEFCATAGSSLERRNCTTHLLWNYITYDLKLPDSKGVASLCGFLPTNPSLTTQECQTRVGLFTEIRNARDFKTQVELYREMGGMFAK